jgi:hypothetical protein
MSVGPARLSPMDRVALGCCARTGSAVAVGVVQSGAGEPQLRGRWTLDLTEGLVPDQVFHAAQGLAQAVGYVESAIETVRGVAVRRLDELLRDVPGVAALGVVTGDRDLAVGVAQALASHPLMHAAEGELYRDALLDAAAHRGLAVTGLPRGIADERLRTGGRIAETVAKLGGSAGPPWRKEHKLAAVAALAALEGAG